MNVIGTCSICGGQVCTPELWAGVGAPIPTCTRCGAVAASSGPIIPMRPVEKGVAWAASGKYEAVFEPHRKMDTVARPFCGRPGCCGDEPRSASDLNFPPTWNPSA